MICDRNLLCSHKRILCRLWLKIQFDGCSLVSRNTRVCCWFYVNLTQARVIVEMRNSTEKTPPPVEVAHAVRIAWRRRCLHQLDLCPSLWCSFLINDLWGRSQLMLSVAIPRLAVLGSEERRLSKPWQARQQASLRPQSGPLHRFLPPGPSLAWVPALIPFSGGLLAGSRRWNRCFPLQAELDHGAFTQQQET